MLAEVDWVRSPLGRPEAWPGPLRTIWRLMLGSKMPMFAAWGPELSLIYNDGYAQILGAKHPAALGAPMREVWAEIWPDIEPLVASTLAGDSVYREDLPLTVNRRGFDEAAWFTFSYTAVLDDDGSVAGMYCAVAETTAKVQSDRRRAFRAKLDEALAGIDDPHEVMDAAVEALGKHLGANRVGYTQMLADGVTGVCESCYADGVSRLSGPFRIADYGPESVARQLSGEPEVWADVTEDPEQVQETWARLDTRAFVSVPLVRDGRLRASLFVNSKAPRSWSTEEVALIEHVAARTWDAVERARAEKSMRESEIRFRNMADHAPVMMWITDQDGSCVYLNRGWYEFTGQTEAEALGFGWLNATHPDDRPRTEAEFLDANARHVPFRSEYRLRRADGTYRWAIDAAAPRFGGAGEFLGYVGSVIDIQERRESEEQLRRNETRLQTLMNAMPAFVWLADRNGELNYFNDRWYGYTGQTPQTALPNGWIDILHPDDVERTGRVWADALSTVTEYQIEVRYGRQDGQYRWYQARAVPVYEPDGAVAAWLGVSLDIHDSKMAAEHQSLLINELNHRVKNTLATVQSMAAQTVRHDGDPRLAHEAFMGRLMALSAAHNVLTEQLWAGAEMEEVVAGAARTFSEPGETRFRSSGPRIWLPPKTALALSMALHELGTNASKYGALSTPVGWVTVEWRPQPGERLQLVWREQGGPPVAPPARKGFGSRLLERGLAAELSGTVRLDFQPDGLVCTVDAQIGALT